MFKKTPWHETTIIAIHQVLSVKKVSLQNKYNIE
jgi:hypothetical protein